MQARTKGDADGAAEEKRAGLRGKSFVGDKISEVERWKKEAERDQVWALAFPGQRLARAFHHCQGV